MLHSLSKIADSSPYFALESRCELEVHSKLQHLEKLQNKIRATSPIVVVCTITHYPPSFFFAVEYPEDVQDQQEEQDQQQKEVPQPSDPSGGASAASGGRRNPPGGKSSLILG